MTQPYMKPCERGEALVDVADKFTKIISNLTEEIKSLRLRIETLEDTQHDTAIDIGDSVKQLQVVTESIACGMAHK